MTDFFSCVIIYLNRGGMLYNMKKLNRKGFTLVELLAVIIILAIVVGITIPAVLTMVDSARAKAGEDGAAVVADWVDKQYGLVSIGFGSADTIFTAVCSTTGETCIVSGSSAKTLSSGQENFDEFVTTAGLKTSDVESITIVINRTTGRSCITIIPKQGGNFYVNRNGAGQSYSGGNCTTSSSSSSG